MIPVAAKFRLEAIEEVLLFFFIVLSHFSTVLGFLTEQSFMNVRHIVKIISQVNKMNLKEA